MKKLNFLLLLSCIISLLSATSCATTEDSMQIDGKRYPVSFRAEITRMAYDAETDGAISVTLQDGDVIYVTTTDGTWGSSSSNLPVEFTYNATTGLFENSSATLPAGNYTFIAEYAASNQRRFFLSGNQTHKLYASQTQISNSLSHLKDNDCMVAQASGTIGANGSDIPTFFLKHLYSVAYFEIENKSSQTITPTSVKMTISGEDINGIFNITNIDSASISSRSENSSTLTLNLTDISIKSGSSHTVYAMIAPFDNYSGSISVAVALANGKILDYTATANNLSVKRATTFTPDVALEITDDMLSSGDNTGGGNEGGVSTAKYDWAELPVMTDADGDGRHDTDTSLYYAHHLCAGSEKNAQRNGSARNYTVCYSADHHCPLWVAAPRHRSYESGASRTDAYGKDPKIPSSIQYSSTKTGGGCNKGHMLGSAERLSSTATNKQVFYYTNIAPQYSDTFNTGGGAWNNLEDHIDGLVCSDTLYVVIGCYFDTFSKNGASASPNKITFGGRSDVSCPTMFYYALLRTKSGSSGKRVQDCSASELQCAAFTICHEMTKGHKPQAADMMSISELERLTGVTYFPNVKNAPKDSYNSSDWL